MQNKLDSAKIIKIISIIIFVLLAFYCILFKFTSFKLAFITIKQDLFALAFAKAISGVILIFVIDLIEKLFRTQIPNFIKISYYLFLLGSILYGEFFLYYEKIPIWDTILHAFSGTLLTMLGYILFINHFKLTKITNYSLALVAIISIFFATFIGVLWEIYEFSIDYIFATNMQSTYSYLGEAFYGYEAVADTMKDLIINLTGSLVGTAIIYLILSKKGTDSLE
ncbi:MAG: hypothetical protein ACK5G7_03015 [Erysipelotrichaceae bacterium]